jgi:hypothetical protein
MPSYWLDTNAFIEPYKGPYSFGIVPGFWVTLERLGTKGTISSPMEVFDELMEKLETKDRLAVWAKGQKGCLFTHASESAQHCYAEVDKHVRASFPSAGADKFMADADSWLVAHSIADSGSALVTHETPSGPGSQWAKIPNVCKHFGIKWINVYQMLEALGIQFVADDE